MQKSIMYHTVFVNYSALNSIKTGKFYTTLKKGDEFFLFDEFGKLTLAKEPEIKWKEVDPVVMIAKINSSLLDSVLASKIYRIFNDEQNDERYLIDENGEKVLFDKMIFKYELI